VSFIWSFKVAYSYHHEKQKVCCEDFFATYIEVEIQTKA